MIRIHTLDARHDAVGHTARNRELSDLFPLPLAGLRAIYVAAVHRFFEHLFEDEGVPLAPLEQEVSELRAHLVDVEDRAHHRLDLRSPEGLELHDLRTSRAPPPLDDRRERVLSVHLVAP